MRTLAWALAILLSAPTALAQAPPPGAAELFATAELDYKIEDGLACPTAAELRAAVEKALFYDPFSSTPIPVTGWRVRVVGVPSGRFRIAVGREDRKLVARVSFADPGNKPVMSTAFEGAPVTERTCRHIVLAHVVEEVAVQMSLVGIRLARARTPPSAPEAPIPAPPAPASPPPAPPCPEYPWSIWPDELPMPPLEKPKPDPPKPLERWPFAVRFTATTWTEVIASGWGSVGLSGGVGARFHDVSLDVEVHGDPSVGSQVFPYVGSVRFARLSGALLLCARWGYFAGCGFGDAGRFLFPDHVPALPASTFYGAAGVRLKLEFPVAPPQVFLSVAMDLHAPVPPAKYVAGYGNTTIFETAGPAVGLGLGLLFELPPR